LYSTTKGILRNWRTADRRSKRWRTIGRGEAKLKAIAVFDAGQLLGRPISDVIMCAFANYTTNEGMSDAIRRTKQVKPLFFFSTRDGDRTEDIGRTAARSRKSTGSRARGRDRRAGPQRLRRKAMVTSPATDHERSIVARSGNRSDWNVKTDFMSGRAFDTARDAVDRAPADTRHLYLTIKQGWQRFEQDSSTSLSLHVAERSLISLAVSRFTRDVIATARRPATAALGSAPARTHDRDRTHRSSAQPDVQGSSGYLSTGEPRIEPPKLLNPITV